MLVHGTYQAQKCLGYTYLLSLLAPQSSRFGDKLTVIPTDLSSKRNCGSHRICISTAAIRPVRLFIMRIRFRASDFGLVAKNKSIRAKSKKASCAEMLGSFVFLLV